MKKKIKYTDLPPGDEPIGELEPMEDFLPPPHKLVFRKDEQYVTLSLKKSTIEFFKKESEKKDLYYQTIIEEIIEDYVNRQKK